MNLKSYIQLEVVRQDRVYYFQIPLGSPYEEARSVAQECIDALTSLQEAALKHEQEQRAQQVKEEDVR